MSVEETEVSHELRAFFQKVLDVFWLKSHEELDSSYPRVNTGTIAHALLKAYGLRESSTGALQTILQVFPEAREVIWDTGKFLGGFGSHLYGLQKVTTPRAVNEFLISDIAINKLREAFPEAVQAMERQEEVRGLEQ